jgi:hypothetical protein
MTQTITQYGREIKAGETTPLTLSALAQFFGFGRSKLYEDVRRGYQPEFGSRTTPRHYRAWLAKNPKIRKKSEKRLALEHELSRLS